MLSDGTGHDGDFLYFKVVFLPGSEDATVTESKRILKFHECHCSWYL